MLSYQGLINRSTAAVHRFEKSAHSFTASLPSYGPNKNAVAVALQLVAADSDPDQLLIVSLHPGVLHSQIWQEDCRIGPEDLPFDNFELPGSFAI